jgi:hypothetical protein
MKFETIEQIKAHEWAGCYFSDSHAFHACEQFFLDTRNSIADRAACIRVIDEVGMGLDPSPLSDEELVEEATREFWEMVGGDEDES